MIKITSLKVIEKESEFQGSPIIPYLIVNLTFKVDQVDPHVFESFKFQTEEYQKVINIGSPEEDENRLLGTIDTPLIDWNKLPPLPMVWTYKDTYFQYIEKFDTFHFREYISDCTVTRAIIRDLRFFQEFGNFPDLYRGVDEHIFLQHVITLFNYWD